MLAPKTGKRIFEEIWVRDEYRFRSFKGSPQYFIDVGANVGFTSVLFRALHPLAQIIAIEPTIETVVKYLIPNTSCLNIKIDNSALGDGAPFYLLANRSNSKNMFISQSSSNTGQKISSYCLSDFFEKHEIDLAKSYALKIDCEGGEAFLYGDSSAEEILRNASYVGIEFHTKNEKGISLERFKDWSEELFGNKDFKISWLSEGSTMVVTVF